MDKNKQRIAIAEFLGWRLRWQNVGGGELYDEKPKGNCWEAWNDPHGCGLDEKYDEAYPPNYLSDLNAMHGAWESLSFPQQAAFAEKLHAVMGLDGNICGWIKLIGATAEQRAEAFLKTIGKWEDSK